MSSSRSTALPFRPAGLIARFQLGERFGPLAYRDFRLVFVGQATSAVGSWMQVVAQGWLVYSLTGSSFHRGVVRGPSGCVSWPEGSTLLVTDREGDRV
jgi:hypothetical protein